MSLPSVTIDHQNRLSSATFGKRFSFESEVSRSQTSSLFRAVDVETGRTLALKLFHRRFSMDPRFAIRFREHMKTLQTIEHENLAAVLDYGVIEGRYYIATEWIDGPDLSAYLVEHGPLGAVQAISLARQVCSALEALHRHGILHSNLKPQNILLSTGRGVKVTDTGLGNLISASGLTRTHVLMGRFHYIAPEQAVGQAVGPGADLYSLGVLLYEMLVNHPPFESRDAWEVLHMHSHAPYPSPEQANPKVPPDLAAIVLRALQKDPSQRFSSAAGMNEVLGILAAREAAPPIEMLHLPDPHIGSGRVADGWLVAFLRNVPGFLLAPVRLGRLGWQLPFVFLVIVQLILSVILTLGIIYLLSG
jgi:serine/threonine protein kinase